jgi:hypothetical protein
VCSVPAVDVCPPLVHAAQGEQAHRKACDRERGACERYGLYGRSDRVHPGGEDAVLLPDWPAQVVGRRNPFACFITYS